MFRLAVTARQGSVSAGRCLSPYKSQESQEEEDSWDCRYRVMSTPPSPDHSMAFTVLDSGVSELLCITFAVSSLACVEQVTVTSMVLRDAELYAAFSQMVRDWVVTCFV